MKKTIAGDFLIYDKSSNSYRPDPEQVVRDDVEKHYWKNVVRTILKDWRLYVMLIPMLLVGALFPLVAIPLFAYVWRNWQSEKEKTR